MFPSIKPSKKLIYLDHAATTPLDSRVQKAMVPFWSGNFGNPSSLYKQGREAKAAIKKSRKKIADILGARPKEIIFTAGGTESVNLAIFGTVRYLLNQVSLRGAKSEKSKATKQSSLEANINPHIITSAIEHDCVIQSCKALEQEGAKVTYVGVDECGFVKIDEIKKAIRPETVLISIMYANNEIGSIQPIAEIGGWLKRMNTDRMQNGLTRIIFHTDACQAAGFMDVRADHLGVDLLSANGSKIYGPKQTGFLYVRSGAKIYPLIYGGGQEMGLRSGTENVPGILGLAEAFYLAQKNKNKESERLTKLRDYFIRQLFIKVDNMELNGPDKLNRLPNNISVTIKGVEGEALLLYLDSYNIAASTGSACSTQSNDPSHVILAIGKTSDEATSAVRFTLGKETKKADLDYVLKVLPGLVSELRRIK